MRRVQAKDRPPHPEDRQAHRGVARGAVGAVDVGVLQWQLLPVLPGGINPVQGVGASPEEPGW